MPQAPAVLIPSQYLTAAQESVVGIHDVPEHVDFAPARGRNHDVPTRISGGRLTPAPEADARTTCVCRSSTVTVAVIGPGAETMHRARSPEPLAHPDHEYCNKSPSGSEACATTSIVQGIPGEGVHSVPAGKATVTDGGRLGSRSPSPNADDDTVCPWPSSTVTVAATVPGSLIVQRAVGDVPVAHPDHAYVSGSLSGSDAVAATSSVHENEPCGMHELAPVNLTLTDGSRF